MLVEHTDCWERALLTYSCHYGIPVCDVKKNWVNKHSRNQIFMETRFQLRVEKIKKGNEIKFKTRN